MNEAAKAKALGYRVVELVSCKNCRHCTPELLKASRICPATPAKHITASRRKCAAFELTLF
jgi:hypothetical protein